ncbi:unnamed protein product [Oncorhynchus mykiss]|uniref:Reverse transcriptase domain-containing protein n=1 Tax=Oncorhynchus mykiss TaxID=8022 RepID=A0A060VTS2_ONCMY|nr:unnamed protein product [Oncorhynchus mykiss]
MILLRWLYARAVSCGGLTSLCASCFHQSYFRMFLQLGSCRNNSYPSLLFPHASRGPPLSLFPRKLRSTDDAISTTLHTSLTQLDKRNTYVRMLFINYSSAFNTIVPSKLVIKLETLGLDPALCNWVLDFLTGRPQVVRARLQHHH